MLAGAVIVAVLAGLTAHRVPVWNSDQALWARTLQQSPHRPRVLENAGISVANDDIKRAERLVMQAMQESSDGRRYGYEQTAGRISSQVNLAWLLIQDRQPVAANALLEDILRTRPDVLPAHFAHAVTASIMGRCDVTKAEVAWVRSEHEFADVSCAP